MRTLAVIPARGGSKGLPRKNLLPLAGIPLIEHSIRLAALCPEVDRVVVSTDSDEIADVARTAGAEVPFIRPAELARDDTPMLPVLRHVLDDLDPAGEAWDLLLLLDPTSPGRLPEDVARAHALLAGDAGANGVVAVSEPSFNPIWHAVVERDGYMEQLFAAGRRFGRRQDLPRVLRINAALYLFRSTFLRGAGETWLDGRHLMLEIPDARAIHIDDRRDLELCELLVEAGRLRLPWLEEPAASEMR
jgi:N-acylneuraminate cytidylyltransferase